MPLEEIAYFTPIGTAPNKGSVMHLTDGSVLNFSDFSVHQFAETFGFIYLPKDRIAFSFSTGEIMYNAGGQTQNEPTIIAFRANEPEILKLANPGKEPLLLEVKTPAHEIDAIIAATKPIEVPVYKIEDGEIKATHITLDYTPFKRAPSPPADQRRLPRSRRSLPAAKK